VVDLNRESVPAILRQVAQLLNSENKRLHSRLRQLTAELAKLKGAPDSTLQAELIQLQEQLADSNQRLFGDSSEKRSALGRRAPKEKKPQRGHGPTPQPELGVVDVPHVLDEADRICPKCGGALCEWQGQAEWSEEIDIVERQFVLKKHERKKYRCGGCQSHIDTALGPPKLIKGGRYSIEFTLAVAIGKYLDHLPLARQAKMMKCDGVFVTTQTLFDQLYALAQLHEKLPQRILAYLKTKPCLGADETTWRLLDKRGKDSGSCKWFAWTVAGDDSVVYHVDKSRGAHVIEGLLDGYDGHVMADGYRAYQSAESKGEFTLSSCWSHARRGFVKAEDSYPREANAIRALIDELFRIEADAASDRERRARLRDERSRYVTAAIKCWMDALDGKVLPKSSLGKAVSYIASLWATLTRFLDDPDIPDRKSVV
jgi:transposase